MPLDTEDGMVYIGISSWYFKEVSFMTDIVDDFIYLQVADDLRIKIKEAVFPKGRLPSERDLSVTYKINRITLRKALGILEKEKLICRLGTKGTFVSDVLRPAKKSSNKIIAFVLVNRNNLDQFHSVTLMALEKACRKSASQIMFFTVENREDVKAALSRVAERRILDGIIVSGLVAPPVLNEIRKLGIPLVLLGHLMYADPLEYELDRLILDSLDYSYKATEYLIKKGHREIALINGPSYQWFLNIYQGYMKALSTYNIEYSEKLAGKCGTDTPEAAFSVMKNMLEERKISAVFAATERIARGAIDAIKEKNLKVPGDIDIISVGSDSGVYRQDNIAMLSFSAGELAETALKLLTDRIYNPGGEAVEKRITYKITEYSGDNKNKNTETEFVS